MHKCSGETTALPYDVSVRRSLLRHFMKTWRERPLRLRLMGVRMSEFGTDESGLEEQQSGKQIRLDAFLMRTSQRQMASSSSHGPIVHLSK